MSATSHWGTRPCALPAARWQWVTIGLMAFVPREGWEGIDTEEIKGATDMRQVRAADPQVAGGGIERAVSAQQLEGTWVDPRFESMGGA